MRNLKYVSLLLAAGMFAACSDNLDVNKENGAGGGDKTPAYLTISIANNGNSSRANTGTDDGSAEDSGLGNAGTANENKVNTILLVALSEDESSGIAKLYAAGTGGDVSDWTTNTTGTYTTDETLKLSVGTYKILAVANPYADFVSGITETTDLATVRGLYDKITEGKYVPAEDVTTADAAAAVLATADKGVMMGNKAEVTVELKEENTPEHPAEATVEIERAVSKITFRKKAAADGMGDNVYEVPVSAGTVKAKTVEGKINADDSEVTLNVAYDICSPTPNTVYVLVNDVDKTTTVYGAPEQGSDVYRLLEAKTQEDYNQGTAENKEAWYVVKDTSKPWESLNYQFDEESATAGNWYVRIEGYALTNLSKEQNHVRHIGDGHGVSTPFGTLNGNNYLITPYWADKNGVTFDENGDFENTPATTTWFYNTLADVSAESENLTIDTDGSFKNGGAAATYYRALPTTDEKPGTVTGGTGTNPEVGARMAYCFENSTDIDHQTHGLSTGISFVARMYKDESCKQPITTLYQYNGYNFESLKAIGEAFGANTPKKIQDLIDKETASTPITKEDLEAAGIKQYSGNICYYYTTEIKHFDNGNNNTLGNMEFAIMRNNIYSLAITNISKIGDPIVDPTPETPNETKEAALKVSVKIIPWIVRYNDIEF
ncbi:fimbria major subunit [Phocaeicola barnesiae]|uniref:fimbria major subunit n=1 Tax=Phocaeicola barnesiae TaxID=376804 RepID=UPI0025A3801A|nr:fimbria major subunit [Phocaeicola barnesiae]MDM8252242.1 fimbria major subunit [Phocaeicola barnesiae]